MKIKKIIHSFNINLQKFLVLGIIFAFAGGAVAYAQFYRTSGGLDFGFGYGYGFSAGHGYGYGYRDKDDADGLFGFFGDDGSAKVDAKATGPTTIEVTYITEYNAVNQVQYGKGNFNSNNTATSQVAGEYTVELTGLSCNTEYDIRVSSEDAGGNVWNDKAITVTTSACSSGGGGGGSSGGSISSLQTPATTLSSVQIASLMAQVQELLKLTTALMQQRGLMITPPGVAGVSFDRTLRLLMTGDDVREFQRALNSLGYLVATSGDGAPGNETRFFGLLTRDAVIRFQTAQGLVADGIVGPLTRAALLKALGI
jgi:hypothetical protein